MTDYSAACPACNQVITDPILSLDASLIEEYGRWRSEHFYNLLLVDKDNLPQEVEVKGRTFEVVQITRADPGSYGEFYQGYSGEGFVIFKLEGVHYKKEFTVDSYDGAHFEPGNLAVVTPQERTITTYVYE